MFIQTFFLAIITFVTSLAVAIYGKVWHIDGSFSGRYFYLTSKINTIFKIIMFLPIIFQFGVLIISSHMHGRQDYFGMKKILFNAIYLSIIINLIFYLLIFFISPLLLPLSGVKDQPVYGWETKNNYEIFLKNKLLAKKNGINETEILNFLLYGGDFKHLKFENTYPLKVLENELSSSIKFIRIALLELFIFSVAQIFCSSLISSKKNLYASISYSLGLLTRLFWTFFVFTNNKIINSFYFSFEGVAGSLVHFFLSLIFLKKFLFKGEKYKLKYTNFDIKFISKLFVIGLPIALESGIWYFSQFLIARSIPLFNLQDKYIGIFKALNSLYDVFASFAYGLSFLASSFISEEYAKNNVKEIKLIQKSLFKIALIVQIIFGLINIALTKPLLKIYSINNNLILSIGYILMFIYSLKLIADLGNLITLRSLWGVNITWYPLSVSILTMIILQIFITYSTLELLNNKNINTETIFCVFVFSTITDPLTRTIIYKIKWNKLFRKIYFSNKTRVSIW